MKSDRIAFILGDFEERLLKMLQPYIFIANQLHLSEIRDREEALSLLQQKPGVGQDLALVILCAEMGGAEVADIKKIRAIRPHSGRVVVMSQNPLINGDLAIQCIQAGARDFLISDYANPQDICEHLIKAINGKSPYQDPIPLPDIRRREDVFVVTPFRGMTISHDCSYGIVPACTRAFDLPEGPLRGDDRHEWGHLFDKVKRRIDESKIVIANLSRENDSPHNVNVYFEVGYAMGTGKDVFLVLRRDAETLPANIAGINVVPYAHCTDLALQLYHLMKQPEREAA